MISSTFIVGNNSSFDAAVERKQGITSSLSTAQGKPLSWCQCIFVHRGSSPLAKHGKNTPDDYFGILTILRAIDCKGLAS